MKRFSTVDELEAEVQKQAQEFLRLLPHPYDKALNMTKCYKAMCDWYMRKGALPSTGHYVHMPDECSVNLTERHSLPLISNKKAVATFNDANPRFYLYRHPMDSYYRLFVKPEAFFKEKTVNGGVPRRFQFDQYACSCGSKRP